MITEPKPVAAVSETRRSLLSAAAQVIRQQGIRKLTLEATAQAAGVSKGGLLYHFPTKQALISALVHYGFEEFDATIARRMHQGMDWLQAYLDASLSPGELDDLGPALLGALAENPELLAPARGFYRQWYSQARETGGIGAVLTLLVLDGLFIHQTLGLDQVISAKELSEGLIAMNSSASGGKS